MEGREPAFLSRAPGTSFGSSWGRGDVRKVVAVQPYVVKPGVGGACGFELETKGQEPLCMLFRILEAERDLSYLFQPFYRKRVP